MLHHLVSLFPIVVDRVLDDVLERFNCFVMGYVFTPAYHAFPLASFVYELHNMMYSLLLLLKTPHQHFA